MQCESLHGLLICDVLRCPWLQTLRRLFLRITLDPLARDLFTFASRNGTVAERNDLAVVAHRAPPQIAASTKHLIAAWACAPVVGVEWSVTVPARSFPRCEHRARSPLTTGDRARFQVRRS